MNKNQIKTEIEKVRKQLQDLEKKLETAKDHNLGDFGMKHNIIRAAHNFRDTLAAAGLKNISCSFGEVTNANNYANRSLFLGSARDCNWEWAVRKDDHGDQVLLRVDKKSGECID